MADYADPGIETFRAEFSGHALTPGHPDYDRSRAIWNGAIDRKPAVIACCTTAEQVADAIRFARASGLEIAVRGGGHSYEYQANCRLRPRAVMCYPYPHMRLPNLTNSCWRAREGGMYALQ